MRVLLRALFALDDRFELVGESDDGEGAIELVERMHPDLLVLDRQMPRLGGIEALPEIRRRSPATAVVLYTARADSGTYQAAIAAGAVQVMDKSEVGGSIVDRLASALVGHWAEQGGEIEVRVGPTASNAALVWIDNTTLILAAVRAHPEMLAEPVPSDVLDLFDRFLIAWRDVASASPDFYWVARAGAEEVTRLVESWATIDRIPDDRLHAVGVDWAPPEGRPFFEALTPGVLAALEAHAETQELAAALARQWPAVAAS